MTLLVAFVVGGCTSLIGPEPSGGATIGMVNATTIPVAVHVNGTWLGTFPPMSEQRVIVVTGHGGPPWTVEFFGPHGERISDLDVSLDESGGSTGWSSTCGQFVAWFRAVPSDLPPLDPAVMRPANPPCT